MAGRGDYSTYRALLQGQPLPLSESPQRAYHASPSSALLSDRKKLAAQGALRLLQLKAEDFSAAPEVYILQGGSNPQQLPQFAEERLASYDYTGRTDLSRSDAAFHYSEDPPGGLLLGPVAKCGPSKFEVDFSLVRSHAE